MSSLPLCLTYLTGYLEWNMLHPGITGLPPVTLYAVYVQTGFMSAQLTFMSYHSNHGKAKVGHVNEMLMTVCKSCLLTKEWHLSFFKGKGTLWMAKSLYKFQHRIIHHLQNKPHKPCHQRRLESIFFMQIHACLSPLLKVDLFKYFIIQILKRP